MIEEEADDAEAGFVVVEIKLGAGGRTKGENFRIVRGLWSAARYLPTTSSIFW